MKKIEQAIAGIGKRFIGGFGTQRTQVNYASHYMPHQGKREMARRVRQLKAGQIHA